MTSLNDNITPTIPKLVVHSTWNESRNDEFPQVLEYRQKWLSLGFEVKVTPNQDIRSDIVALDKLEPSLFLLQMFDYHLATTNMKYDVWRYTKLYLEGGIYADADVEPLEGILHYASLSSQENKPIIFEESNWPSNTFTKTLIPLVSDYHHLPAYGTCLVVSPSTPHNAFLLSLLKEMHPDDWKHVKEPKRTLMSVGPGHVTQYIQTHPDESILVGYKQRSTVYIHHGFGTWKSWMPKEVAILCKSITGILLLLILWKKFNKTWRIQRQHDNKRQHAASVVPTTFSSNDEQDEAALSLVDQAHLRKRHNHSPETTIDNV